MLADRSLLFLRCGDFELALEDSEAAGKNGPWAMRPRLFQALALISLGRADECEKLAVQKLIRLEALTAEFLETMGRLDSEISAERNNLWFPGERAMTIKPGAPRRYMMAALRRKACCP